MIQMLYCDRVLNKHKFEKEIMKMKKFLAILMAAAMSCALLTACGGETTEPAEGTEGEAGTETALVYAVETGSAGEAAATENGWEVNAVASQADALMEVASGTSDAAVIDLLMADAMIGEGTSYPDMVTGDELTTEEYGIGFRVESDLTGYINWVLSETYADGTMQGIADTYKVGAALVAQPAVEEPEIAADGDVAYIQEKGTLVVGITDFAPMDYKNDAGEWIGFDADMAKIVAEKLGVAIEFIEIDWDNKIMELDSKNIDVVWNGMTLTDEVMNAMNCTNPYCNNAQVVVLPGAAE